MEAQTRSRGVPALPCFTVPVLSTRRKDVGDMSRLMSLACHAPHVRVFRGFPICQAGAGNRNILPGRGYLIVRLVGQHDMRVTGVSRAVGQDNEMGSSSVRPGAGNRNILPGRAYLIVRLVRSRDTRITTSSGATWGH